MKYLKLAPLVVFTLCLVCASVAISVINWASMPSERTGELVAGAIAFGVEGAKLFLVPFAVIAWRTARVQSILAWAMGSVMTVISVGGIVIWMDGNLSFNAGRMEAQSVKTTLSTGENQQALARKQTLLAIAKDFTDKGYLTKAKATLAQADAIVVPEVQVRETKRTIGLVIPFKLSESGRWLLLASIACTIDLGALLLVTILMTSLRSVKVEPVVILPKEPDVVAIEPPELEKDEQEVYDAILDGKHCDDEGVINGAKRIGLQHGVGSIKVSKVVALLKDQGHVEFNGTRYQLRAA